MTTRLDSSDHFLPANDLPEFDGTTPILEIYKELTALGRGAFIYRAGAARYFVKADRLADHLFAAPKAGRRTSAENTADRPSRAEWTLKQALASIPGGDVTIPIPHAVDVGTDAAPLQQRGDMVYPVVEEKEPLGWFLNHEKVLIPATRRVYFVCENGHENDDPDHDVCYECPGFIVGTVSR